MFYEFIFLALHLNLLPVTNEIAHPFLMTCTTLLLITKSKA